MNTTVIANAVSVLNAANQTKVQSQAINLIESIRNRQAAIAQQNRTIADAQVELAKIAGDIITDVSILGTALPDAASQNENQKTIAKVVDTLNKARQGDVLSRSSRLASLVTASQDNIVALNKEIAKLQADLATLQVETVTEAQITGDTTGTN